MNKLEEPKIYGYCRISRKEQSIERQMRNIRNGYPNAIILQESCTGTKMDRPEWMKLVGVSRNTYYKYKRGLKFSP